MNLLAGAAEFVLWCVAGVIGFALAVVVALWAWDKWSGSRWEKNMRAKR